MPGSLTKQSRAASILLLEQQGRLKVNDFVLMYFAVASATSKGITLFNLLTPTSGIPNLTSSPDFLSTEWKDASPQQLMLLGLVYSCEIVIKSSGTPAESRDSGKRRASTPMMVLSLSHEAMWIRQILQNCHAT